MCVCDKLCVCIHDALSLCAVCVCVTDPCAGPDSIVPDSDGLCPYREVNDERERETRNVANRWSLADECDKLQNKTQVRTRLARVTAGQS